MGNMMMMMMTLTRLALVTLGGRGTPAEQRVCKCGSNIQSHPPPSCQHTQPHGCKCEAGWWLKRFQASTRCVPSHCDNMMVIRAAMAGSSTTTSFCCSGYARCTALRARQPQNHRRPPPCLIGVFKPSCSMHMSTAACCCTAAAAAGAAIQLHAPCTKHQRAQPGQCCMLGAASNVIFARQAPGHARRRCPLRPRVCSQHRASTTIQ
ncbi:hypothetical protein COO60DRAFT_914979 [Scenedesmus sp. NREL 46B-D3]|nr:hypothetical protein COO60DRAFT_914979 [Scenedesmus sp. NREL 46B-D3]